MQYKRFMDILQALAVTEVGYSVGDVQRICDVTRGEGETVLRTLHEMGWVNLRKEAYRPNINKNIYTLNRAAIDFMIDAIVAYSRARHQGELSLLIEHREIQE